jgi:hypothetical protein
MAAMTTGGVKLHFGALKKEKPFLTFHGSISEADLAFYDGYDPDFIAKKVVTLSTILNHPAAFAEATKAWAEPLDTTEDTYLGAIAAEIHCAAIHQSEVLLSLLLAAFQPRPHWVYLSSYGNPEMKNAAKLITDGEFGLLTGGEVKTLDEFVRLSVYAGFSPQEEIPDFKSSIDDIGWLVRHVAELYAGAAEYNAYKHGLRVIFGSAVMGVKMKDSEQYMPVISMKQSLTFLQLSEVDSGYTAQRVTKEIRPDYSAGLVGLMAIVLSITRDMRIARIKQSLESVPGLRVDREKLLRMKPAARFSSPY